MYRPDSSGIGSLRSRFTNDSLETASGPKVIVMCFDRLERDLDNALTSIANEDHDATNSLLRHAQDLIGEMVAMLDVDAWEHAPALLSVYDYLLRRLAQANALKDAAAVREARHLISELGEGFRGAAETVAAAPTTGATHSATHATANPATEHTAPLSFDAAGGVERPRLSVRA